MRRVSLCLVALAGAAALAGCRGQKAAPPQMPPARVTVVRPVGVPVRDYWLYNGYLETTKAVEVRSKIRGFLTKVEFAEGTEVAENDPLYKIDQREFKTAYEKADAELKHAQADIEIKKAQKKQALTDLERVKATGIAGVEARATLDTAQANYEVRVAELAASVAAEKAAAAALHSTDIVLGYTDVRAKIGGRVSRTLVDEGNLVLADTTLLTTIVKVDELYVYFDAPEADLTAYQKALIKSRQWADGWKPPDELEFALDRATLFITGLGASIPVEVGVTGEDGYPHVGRIDFRENRVETATGTIRIRGRVDNPKVNSVRVLYPGMYARVRVPKSEPVPQLVVPEDCLLTGQEGRFLYVIGANNQVEKRVVTVGAVVWKAPPSGPGEAPPSWVATNPKPSKPVEGRPPAPTRRAVKSVVAIVSGLKPDDRVILDGIQKVRPGAPADPEEWNLTPPSK
jgi:RND family efflux transporter MFP subunit